MINVGEEKCFAEALLAAQMMFKHKNGRYPSAEENQELAAVAEKVAKIQVKSCLTVS